MQRPEWVPAGTDVETPNAARVYDYYLGGSHNFAADRDMAREALALWPDLPEIMRANRAFLRRSVSYVAAQGVSRFIDIGSGIPTYGAVHEVARPVRPDTRVVYVDDDPIAVAHSRLMLKDDPRCAMVAADMTDPVDLLSRPEIEDLLRPGEPVAVLLVAVLHFVPDSAAPAKIVATLREAMPPGSYLVLSHASQESRPEKAAPLEALYARTATPLTMRTRQQVATFFEGFEMVEPGIVWLNEWHPDDPESVGPHPELLSGLTGVGIRP
ncbi:MULTISPECIES: SAM-dependent methyltransferase [unclassified Streptomyces]|uniref:SAM-dependent methyltransferase n=1 Tax=unclassified Streptomyces TaxID=2593676 RepID=UPI0038120836